MGPSWGLGLAAAMVVVLATVWSIHTSRRRWWSVALGLLMGTAALIVARMFVPPQLEVEALLELSHQTTDIGKEGLIPFQQAAWEQFKATQAQLVKTDLGILNALEFPDKETGRPLSTLPIVAAKRDKVGWLQNKIRVSFPGNAAIMAISMKGGDPKQIVKLVNAVTERYHKEFTTGEHDRMKEKLALLESNLNSLKEQYYVDSQKYQARAKQLGSHDEGEFPDLDLMKAQLESLQKQIEHIQIDTFNARLKLAQVDRMPAIEIYTPARLPEGEVDWMRTFMVGLAGALGFFMPGVALVAWDRVQRRRNAGSNSP